MNRIRVSVGLAAAMLSAPSPSHVHAEDAVKQIDRALAPLVSDFNTSKGRPRLITVLSPT